MVARHLSIANSHINLNLNDWPRITKKVEDFLNRAV